MCSTLPKEVALQQRHNQGLVKALSLGNDASERMQVWGTSRPQRLERRGRLGHTCNCALTDRMASEQRLGQVSPLGRIASDRM